MEFLRELFSEPLSFEAFSKAVEKKGIKLVDLSSGKYADMGKLTKANEELKTARESIETLNKELQTLKESNTTAEDFKTKYENLLKKIEEEEKKAKEKKEDEELTDAITAVFGEKEFTSEYVKNGIIADMKSEISKPENKGKGYAQIFEELTKDKEGLFVSPNQIKDMGGFNDVNVNVSDEQMRAVMGLSPSISK